MITIAQLKKNLEKAQKEIHNTKHEIEYLDDTVLGLEDTLTDKNLLIETLEEENLLLKNQLEKDWLSNLWEQVYRDMHNASYIHNPVGLKIP